MARWSGAERLQKVLSHLGVASRREAEQWIRAGRLTINGRPATLGARAEPGDQLRLDGRLVRQQRPERALPVLLCHRSPGIALLHQTDGSQSVADALPQRTGKRFMSISPLPQVDGGLELLCADGELAGRLQRAVRAHPLVYSLRVRGELSSVQEEGIRAGLLDRGATLKVLAVAAAGGSGSNRWYQIDTLGASGNDLRQLIERQGATVSRLMRIQLGTLRLERSLPRGRWRELTADEVNALLNPVPPGDAPAAVPGNPGSGP
ncbi:MAG: rRNA pseudouridine synthase [Gammaproteobacteria bacterium]|nr:rRNA pseudouridine synthase [Gammaproteobacteria bacterium]MDE2250685.1 rRNA pseudouridine synthase [Gammaproteobacteria bacterium]